MPTLRDIMTEDVVTVTPDTSLRAAVEIFQAESVSGLPVVSGDAVVGVVSVTDLIAFEAETPSVPTRQPNQLEWGGIEEEPETWEEGEAPPAAFYTDFWADAGADVVERIEGVDGPEWDQLGEHVVGEVMTISLCALPPETPVREAAATMLDAAIHRVLVMEDSRLLGIVSTLDIVRAVSEGRI
ncbi:MAG: CBS domain-containing protein [Gemmatimonadota bacterium]|nr:CBS domain-containing protein [Gemmatimonadota bacterium]